MITATGVTCPTCHRPLAPAAGSTLLTCAHCERTHVPVAATEISLIARTQVGEVRPVATISLTHEFRDRYELGEVLGSGAMGMVCRARDRSMNREVAIKFLMHIDQADLLQRFLQEGRLLARIRHPNVVPVYDLEDLGGHPYIVTECLEGGTLRQRMASGLAPLAAVEIMASCLDGLAACHASRIVHRDLKPENILFAADGTPKISDLGIAKELAADSVTQTGALIGTPRYMAPEQAQMNTASYASDVHAMGALLYEMIAGRPAFDASGLADILRAITVTVPPPLEAGPDSPLPPGLVRVVARALAKDPAERPSVEEFAAELRKAAGSRMLGARPAREPRVARPPTHPVDVAMAAARGGEPARGLAPSGKVALGLVLATAAGFALAWQSAPPPPRPVVSAASAAPAPVPAPAVTREQLSDLRRAHSEALSRFNALAQRVFTLRISSTRTEAGGRAEPAIECRRLQGVLENLQRTLAGLGSDNERGSLEVIAIACDVDELDWQNRLWRDGFARLREMEARPPYATARSSLEMDQGMRVSLALEGPCSVEDCVRLQRQMRRLRKALQRPWQELAEPKYVLLQLLGCVSRAGQIVDTMTERCLRDVSGLFFDDRARLPQARHVLTALERVAHELVGPRPRHDDPDAPLLDRLTAGLFLLRASGVNARRGIRSAESRVRPEQVRKDLAQLRAMLGTRETEYLERVVDREISYRAERLKLR